jgi:uncharacterized protein YndB with AHSA1/START domain
VSSATICPAPVRKSLVVGADRHRSFQAFTDRMGKWWPRSKTIGTSPPVTVVIEPRAGGRWYERGEDGSECEWGKVLQWDPPARLVLAWQIDGNWKYDPDLVTEVEVTFTSLGRDTTRVDLEHRNLERFGEKVEIMRTSIDSEGGWAGILKVYAEMAEKSA